MKKTTCLMALLFTVSSVIPAYAQKRHHRPAAQLSSVHNHIFDWKTRRVNTILQKQENDRQQKLEHQKTTSILAERVIAYSEYDYYGPDSFLYALGRIDTTALKYNGSKGSQFNFNAMFYELPSNLYGDGYYENAFGTGLITAPGNPNFVPGVLCDTVRDWSSTFPDTSGRYIYMYAYADSSYVSYDSRGNILLLNDQLYPDLSGLDDIYWNTYDASNNNITTLHVQYDPTIPAYDTLDYTIHIFNTSGKLIEDSTSEYGGSGFYPSDRWIYTYNSSGYLSYAQFYYDSSGIWQEEQRSIIAYNSDNSIHTDSLSSFTGGVWSAQATSTFGYTAGISYYTYFSSYNYEDGGNFENLEFTKHISAGLPDTVFQSNHSSVAFAPSYLYSASKTVYVYDTYKNPVTATTYNFAITDSAAGTGTYDSSPDDIIHYYYEPYYTTAAVQQIPVPKEQVVIYPNPAGNQLFISRPGAAKGEFTSVSIINSLGQTVMTENLSWNTETESIQLTGIAPGAYLVHITNRNGSTISDQKIIKQ